MILLIIGGIIMTFIFSIFFLFIQQPAYSQDLECNDENYEEFIFNNGKTKRLIRDTDEGCQLEGIDLRGKDLTKANLTLANLKNAKLNNTNLTFASFKDADLRGADLRGAIITNTNFCGIVYDNKSRLEFDTGILLFCRD